MSDPQQFLARWSRRKRAAAQTAQPAEAPAAPASPGATSISPAAGERPKEPARSDAAGAPELPFDPASLPPIESITAATDIRPFLAPGVPPELARAALRRVWTTDPSIRDFVGLADYDWDFNTPGAIPGFGTLEVTAQLRSEIARMVGRSLAGSDSATEAEIRAIPETADSSERSVTVSRDEPPPQLAAELPRDRAPPPRHDGSGLPGHAPVATQQTDGSENVASRAKRLHGRALPE